MGCIIVPKEIVAEHGDLSRIAVGSNMDTLINQGIATTDPAARTEIYQQIAEKLLIDLPWVCLYIGQQYEAMKTTVMDYEHIPTGSNISMRQVWLDQ